MAKRWRKEKAGAQTKRRRRPARGLGDASGAGGTMGGFRRGLRALASARGSKGEGPASRGPLARAIDVLLWVAVVVAVLYAFGRRCGA